MKRKNIAVVVREEVLHESNIGEIAILSDEQLLRIVANDAPASQVFPWDHKLNEVTLTYSIRELVHFMEWAKENNPRIVELWKNRKGKYPEVLGAPIVVYDDDGRLISDPDAGLSPWMVNGLRGGKP